MRQSSGWACSANDQKKKKKKTYSLAYLVVMETFMKFHKSKIEFEALG